MPPGNYSSPLRVINESKNYCYNNFFDIILELEYLNTFNSTQFESLKSNDVFA